MLVAQARGFTVRTFALTESDYAIGMDIDFGKAVDKFNKKLKYDYGLGNGLEMGYSWVEHEVEGTIRLNRHVTQWGTKPLDMNELNDHWHKLYGSLVTWRKKKHGGMVVDKAENHARYLARYVAGDGFKRAHFSHNWVFPGWFDYNKHVKDTINRYPSIYELAALADMTTHERLQQPLYLSWSLKRQESYQRKLSDKTLGMSDLEREWLIDYNKRHRKKLTVY
jgi:hypothetical protein